MAITQALANSFKKQLLDGDHSFATGSDVYKIALYSSSATLNSATTSYTTGNEVGNSGQYTAGGGKLTGNNTSIASGVAIVDFNDLSFTGATITARGALIYNEAATGDPSVCVLDFGGDKTSTNGDFTIQFPAANSTSAILRIS